MNNKNFSGMLVINKPEGMITKDVSRFLIKKFGRLKLGHAGTLDPMAEGVLPILIGSATKLQDYLIDLPKQYIFEVTFGIQTDSFDLDGAINKITPWQHITTDLINDHIKGFIGKISQVPPIYSAVKYKGKPLYKYARDYEKPDKPISDFKRTVNIYHLELLNYSPPKARFKINCSKGTYIRTLANDLGEMLCSSGVLSRIVRTKAAGVKLEKAIHLDTLKQTSLGLEEFLIPLEEINIGFLKWKAYDSNIIYKLNQGQKVLLKNDYFQKCFTSSEDINILGENLPLYILNKSGKALGLGMAKSLSGGITEIIKKRGL